MEDRVKQNKRPLLKSSCTRTLRAVSKNGVAGLSCRDKHSADISKQVREMKRALHDEWPFPILEVRTTKPTAKG